MSAKNVFNQLFLLSTRGVNLQSRKKWLRRLYNLTSVHFKVHKRWFPLLLNTVTLFWPIENWDISEQLRAQTLWFCSLLLKGAAGDEEKIKKQVKRSGPPSTFDGDCRSFSSPLHPRAPHAGLSGSYAVLLTTFLS